jgi:Ca2+-binding RTX toxin-like protein
MARRLGGTAAVALAMGLTGLLSATIAVATHNNPVCAHPIAGVSCTDGAARQTSGGNGKVSHAGWPKITGVLRMADDVRGNYTFGGGPDSDELLGARGNDHIIGWGGNDVIWGDQLIVGNGPSQTDVLVGGDGNDFIYPSHGKNIMRGGAGDDHIIAYYGHGTIDCGAGYDIAQVRANGAYTLHNCEHIIHFCAYGSRPNGDCKQPGERDAIHRRTGRARVGLAARRDK